MDTIGIDCRGVLVSELILNRGIPCINFLFVRNNDIYNLHFL